MSDPYKDLAAVLGNDCIRCQFQSAGQMVVSRQVGPIWPDRGNSFWVTNAADCWYIFTWAAVGYRVPARVDIAALCRSCMDFGQRAMGKLPLEIVREFDLAELSEEDAERVYREMDST